MELQEVSHPKPLSRGEAIFDLEDGPLRAVAVALGSKTLRETPPLGGSWYLRV